MAPVGGPVGVEGGQDPLGPHTSSAYAEEDNSAAAFGDVLILGENYESDNSRSSEMSSRVVQEPSASADCLTLRDGRMSRQTNEIRGSPSTGQASTNSWSTVGYQTLSSRPSSSEFRGDVDFDVEEHHARVPASRTAAQPIQGTNSGNCNSLSFDAASSPIDRRRSSPNVRHLDGGEMSSRTVAGRAYCGDSRSTTLADRSAAMRHPVLRNIVQQVVSHNKSSRSAPLAHAVVRALQQRIEQACASNAAPNHPTSLDSTSAPRRTDLAPSFYEHKPAAARQRRPRAHYRSSRRRAFNN